MYILQVYLHDYRQWLDVNPEHPITGETEKRVWSQAKRWGYVSSDLRVVPVDSPEGMEGKENARQADIYANKLGSINRTRMASISRRADDLIEHLLTEQGYNPEIEHDPEYDPRAQFGSPSREEMEALIHQLREVAMIAAMRTNDDRNVRVLADKALENCSRLGFKG